MLSRSLLPPRGLFHSNTLLSSKFATDPRKKFQSSVKASSKHAENEGPTQTLAQPEQNVGQQQQKKGAGNGVKQKKGRQTVDFSSLAASVNELRQQVVPAKVEQVLMNDRTTLMLRLRTAALQTAWLLISWHPIAGRVGVASGPPSRGAAAEAYSLGDVASSNLSGLVLTQIQMPQAWERVLQLQFGMRPGEPPLRSLYCEIMSRFSNVILTKEAGEIVACGYQVGPQMSSLRQLQAGSTYLPPPVTTGIPPSSCSSMEEWRDIVVRASSLAMEKRQQRKRKPTPTDGTSSRNGNSSTATYNNTTTSSSTSTSTSNNSSSSGSGGPFPGVGSVSSSEHGINRSSATDSNGTSASTASNLFEDAQQNGSASSPNSQGKEGRLLGSGTGSQAGNAPAASGSSSSESTAQLAQGGQLAEGIMRAFQGTSPSLISDMWLAAGLPAESPGAPGSTDVGLLSTPEWRALWEQWQVWLDKIHSGSFTASSDDELTRYSVIWDTKSIPHLTRTHASVLHLLDAYYAEMQSEDRHARLHQQLLSAVQGLHKKVCAKIRTFEAQLLDVSKVEAVQKTADMITANIYRIPPGAKEVECEDWDTGEVVKLPLDPTKSAVEISRDIYKRARKLRRASDAVSPLLEAAFEELEYIEQVLDSLQQLKSRTGPEDEKALMEVQEELVSGGYMKPPPDAALAAKAASKARKANARASKRGDKTNASGDGSSRLRSFVSPGGYQVLVGRNNKQNDVLSHTVAQPEDLWFHIRGRPGSHVALRVGSKAGSPNTRPEIGDEDVQCAADLAAYFSKGRQDLKCDVIVAKAGGLKKPKGAKPGQVLVTKELGNVVARPENVVSLVGKASQDES